jgi:hypothetical protein
LVALVGWAEIVEQCVIPQRHELPPMSDVTYLAFTDPRGGSSDSFTLAIAHGEKEVAVLDAIREVPPPFSPESVVTEFAKLLAAYRVSAVYGDHYAGEWPREQFRKAGIPYKVSEQNRSEIYLELLPKIMSGGLSRSTTSACSHNFLALSVERRAAAATASTTLRAPTTMSAMRRPER